MLAVLVAAVVFGATRLVPEERSRAVLMASALSELAPEVHGPDRVVMFVDGTPIRIEWRRGELSVQARFAAGVGPELDVAFGPDEASGAALVGAVRPREWADACIARVRASDARLLGRSRAVRSRGGLLHVTLDQHSNAAQVAAAARVLAALASRDANILDAARSLDGARFEPNEGPWHGAGKPRVVVERGRVDVHVEPLVAAAGPALAVWCEPPRDGRRFRMVIGDAGPTVQESQDPFDAEQRTLAERLEGAELVKEPKRVTIVITDFRDETVASAVDLVASFAGARSAAA